MLLPDPSAFQVIQSTSNQQSLVFTLKSVRPNSVCPACGQGSTRQHSRYRRTIADLPWADLTVRLFLHVCRFFCVNLECARRIFCERLPDVVARYARKTNRLNEALSLIGFAIGGEAGARTAVKLGMAVSPDTLLRIIRRSPSATQTSPPRALGVDDFAFRRGHTYGTILVDLERRRPVDLLENREATALSSWLKERPGIEVISRDRAGAYAEGARDGAPEAEQVADRWHLLKNVREAFERVIHRNYKAVQRALQVSNPAGSDTVTSLQESIPGDKEQQHPLEPAPPVEPHRAQQYHAERKSIYELVQELRRQGLNINQIRLQIKRHHATVSRFFHAETYPLTTRTRGSRLAAPFMDHLQRRWAEGCHNARQLFKELKDLGYRGSDVTIRRLTGAWREPIAQLVSVPPAKLPTPRSLSWLLLSRKAEPKTGEPEHVQRLLEGSDEISKALGLVKEFETLIRERREAGLGLWLEAARASKLPELENFAIGIRRDEAAVRAAMRTEWSNGQTEGQITRLKLLKRQMYGRAKFDLLKARVLQAA